MTFLRAACRGGAVPPAQVERPAATHKAEASSELRGPPPRDQGGGGAPAPAPPLALGWAAVRRRALLSGAGLPLRFARDPWAAMSHFVVHHDKELPAGLVLAAWCPTMDLLLVAASDGTLAAYRAAPEHWARLWAIR